MIITEKIATEQRQEACKALTKIENEAIGYYDYYLARKTDAQHDTTRDQQFLASCEQLAEQAFFVRMTIESGNEAIHSYGQIVEWATRLAIGTWSDQIAVGNKTSKKGPKGRPRTDASKISAWQIRAKDIWLKGKMDLDSVVLQIVDESEDPKPKLSTVKESIRRLNPNRRTK